MGEIAVGTRVMEAKRPYSHLNKLEARYEDLGRAVTARIGRHLYRVARKDEPEGLLVRRRDLKPLDM